MSTLKDIALKANVAVSTVSYALNHPEKISKSVRDSIYEIAKELGYFKKKRTKDYITAGVIVEDFIAFFSQGYYGPVLCGVMDRLKKHGFLIKIIDYDVEDYILQSIDYCFCIGKTPTEVVEKIKSFNLPVMLVGHPDYHVECSSIMSDGKSGSIQAMDYLVMSGHKSIAYIATEIDALDLVESAKHEGFRYSIERHNLDFKPEWKINCDCHTPNYISIVVEQIKRLIGEITAVYCPSDCIAMPLLRELKANNIKCPEEMSLVGFDGITLPYYAEPMKPVLTTVGVDKIELGKKAVDKLVEEVNIGNQMVHRYNFPVSLFIGETVSLKV